jgi:hypothetical protein
VGTTSQKIVNVTSGLPQVIEVDADTFGTGTVAARPGTGANTGDKYFVQDAPKYRIDIWNGSAWVIMTCKGPSGGTVDNRIARWDGTDGDELNNSGVTLDDNDDMTGIRRAQVTQTYTLDAEYDNGNGGASKTIDWNNGNMQKITLNAATCTITFTAPASGAGRFSLRIIQDSTGGRLISWPTIKWVGKVLPVLSTGIADEDIATFIWNGTSYYGILSGVF